MIAGCCDPPESVWTVPWTGVRRPDTTAPQYPFSYRPGQPAPRVGGLCRMLLALRLLSASLCEVQIGRSHRSLLGPSLTASAVKCFCWERRSSFASAQPAPEKLAAVPFTTTRNDAEAAYEKFHTAFQLLARPHKDKIKETFLPFWIASCSVNTVLTRADIGFTESGQEYNRHTKTWDSVQRTIWRTVHLHQEWDRTYAASNPGLQLYASYKYPR